MKKKRLYIIYFILLITSLYISYCMVDILNSTLKNYSEFIGDILNFSSILTGFLGVLLGLLASMNPDSLIIKAIVNTTYAKKQLAFIIIVPFTIGILNILICIVYRLLLNNQLNFRIMNTMNYLFISSTLLFTVTSFSMTFFIFLIFFNNGNKKKRKTLETE